MTVPTLVMPLLETLFVEWPPVCHTQSHTAYTKGSQLVIPIRIKLRCYFEEAPSEAEAGY
ncbi:unnamed protein product [Fusarium graminearum]|uniref:Chromosome 1, complete genome n=1 Tax=Gibberella zeae (strain ATCC MYA-4620 / CBS 123657 / FGSC 9075 / NRRL 31084 / PH-1) TaxID=229533 RepID=A0A098D8P9_GIBZE|nr:unnamed protein product [Fusarium graminearum]CZS78098.1 unnamed protein product [Fusarium graminearum]